MNTKQPTHAVTRNAVNRIQADYDTPCTARIYVVQQPSITTVQVLPTARLARCNYLTPPVSRC